MQGSQLVIDGLQAVFHNLLSLEQQAHLQEHRFESMRYSFSNWFHAIEEKGHENLIHPVLDRIHALGGTPLSRYAWEVPPSTPDVAPAMRETLSSLQAVHRAYNQACEYAEADDDYVTEKMIHEHLCWVEKKMNKFEARIAQCDKLGERAFLAEHI
jgi:bacterioferritin (cytochrome b1)